MISFDGYRELPKADLIPGNRPEPGVSYVFNPAVIAHGTSMMVFYRIIGPDLKRKIAVCRLGPNGLPVAGSARCFSDEINATCTWYADPRVYILRGRYFVYWNTGYPDEGENQQFLIEFDPVTMSPLGYPIEIIVNGNRQNIEKNWILFERAGQLYAIYSISPHRILKMHQWTDRKIYFTDEATTWWNSASLISRFGPPRGGAQPLARGDRLYHFCHASSGSLEGSKYVAQCYEFERDPPFRITRFTFTPLTLPNPKGDTFQQSKLNKRVSSVVYPAGSIAVDSDKFLISYGINDEASFLAAVLYSDIEKLLEPVKSQNVMYWRVTTYIQALKTLLQNRLGK